MTLQANVAARNAALTARIAVLGASPLLKVFTGTKPANCAATDSGTVLGSTTLPASPFGTVAAGAVAKAGTWEVASAAASGNAGHFRLYTSGGVCVFQGACSAIGAGGEMTLNNVAVVAGYKIIVATCALTEGMA